MGCLEPNFVDFVDPSLTCLFQYFNVNEKDGKTLLCHESQVDGKDAEFAKSSGHESQVDGKDAEFAKSSGHP